MSLLTVQNLSIGYKDKTIVRNINFSIEEGGITSILGVNGSGKSTLIKTLSGVLSAHEGEINFCGTNIKKMAPIDLAKNIAYLSQKHHAPSDISVHDLVAYGRFAHRSFFKSLGSEDEIIIDEAIAMTGMNEFRDRRVSSLSGGEAQKAWLAMCLAQQPKLLLLDEPTTFLDIYHQVEILKLIKQLNYEQNITVIMVLHDVNHALKYSDHLIVLKKGTLYKKGKTCDILNEKLIEEIYRLQMVRISHKLCGEVFEPVEG